jgi:type III pantothenate kinase
MTPDVVVDIGNSRMKWGRWLPESDVPEMVSLSGDDRREWDEQVQRWERRGNSTRWAIASVQPALLGQFLRTLSGPSHFIRLITNRDIPIPIEVDEPDAVGADRLLNALAAGRLKPRHSLAVVISVGTAVTVDLVREDGAFLGGTIFPGPRLMASSLHLFTAKLPELELHDVQVHREPPCKNTRDAMQAGIAYAVMGGAALLVDALTGARKVHSCVILTGGGLGMLADFDFGDVKSTIVRPTLTLEGIRIAAESLP